MANSKNKAAKREQPDLETTLQTLQDAEHGKIDSLVFYGLSGLSSSDLNRVKPVWEATPATTRRKVMRQLVEVSETNFEMDYRTIAMLSLDDSDAGVREAAIDVLWEDETLELMNRLAVMARQDDSVQVRAAVASALGRFILLGELGNLPESETRHAQEAAIALLTDETEEIDVRRRALEAIANCGHAIVPGAIKNAYQDEDRRMRVSAVFAMGRTCDESWEDEVLAELNSEDSEMRYEAAKAAGELELSDAVPHLMRMSMEDEREIKEVSIWSLGEIGGKEAIKALNLLLRDARTVGDDDLVEAIEDALSNASLVSGDVPFMMRFDGDNE